MERDQRLFQVINQISPWHLSWLWPDASERSSWLFQHMFIVQIYCPLFVLFALSASFSEEIITAPIIIAAILGYVFPLYCGLLWALSFVIFALSSLTLIISHKNTLRPIARLALKLFIFIGFMWVFSFGVAYVFSKNFQMDSFWYLAYATGFCVFYLYNAHTALQKSKNTASA